MQVVIKVHTVTGTHIASVDWERELLMDFGKAFQRAAMFLGDQTLIIDMQKAGISIEVQSKHLPDHSGTQMQ
jgi:hypothetical protein